MLTVLIREDAEMENVEKQIENENLLNENDTDQENTIKNKSKNEEKTHKENNKTQQKDKKESIINKLQKLEKGELIKLYTKLLKENEKHKSIIQEKHNEANNYLDRYKRALAEMENIRKRTTLEKQDSLKFANFNIISDFIIILDDFQRAIDAGKADEKMDLSHFVDGVDMIEKQFADLLFKKYGVSKFGENGDEFDPNIHTAFMAEEGDFETETVIEVFRKGYMLHDRVIRPAEVKVGKPKES
jgi:molecular chaperone GrpE